MIRKWRTKANRPSSSREREGMNEVIAYVNNAATEIITEGVLIENGGVLDQYGKAIIIGSNPAGGYSLRPDGAAKLGAVVIPHYADSEKYFAMLSAGALPSTNSLHLGGGDSDFYAVTDLNFYAAADDTTTKGTEIVEITIDGLEIKAGAIKQVQLTGSLTDGAPTAAEIHTITGLTPATAGAGWAATILDSDGTGKMYRVESDGSTWGYLVLTTAA